MFKFLFKRTNSTGQVKKQSISNNACILRWSPGISPWPVALIDLHRRCSTTVYIVRIDSYSTTDDLKIYKAISSLSGALDLQSDLDRLNKWRTLDRTLLNIPKYVPRCEIYPLYESSSFSLLTSQPAALCLKLVQCMILQCNKILPSPSPGILTTLTYRITKFWFPS